MEGFGGIYGSSPSNIWPVDRSWFLWTDADLEGTKVSGSTTLVTRVREKRELETEDWHGQQSSRHV